MATVFDAELVTAFISGSERIDVVIPASFQIRVLGSFGLNRVPPDQLMSEADLPRVTDLDVDRVFIELEELVEVPIGASPSTIGLQAIAIDLMIDEQTFTEFPDEGFSKLSLDGGLVQIEGDLFVDLDGAGSDPALAFDAASLGGFDPGDLGTVIPSAVPVFDGGDLGFNFEARYLPLIELQGEIAPGIRFESVVNIPTPSSGLDGIIFSTGIIPAPGIFAVLAVASRRRR